jgi:translocator protein
MKNWVKAVISMATPQIVGITSSLFNETGEGSWYRSIVKPEWNPPGWVFAPVWTTLYLMMGIAFYIIWKSNAPSQLKNRAIGFWIVQLILNFFWTFIFFGQQQIAGALLEMFALWLMILLAIFALAHISKLAAWMMVPYIAWVSFALLLNYTIWQLNR